MSRIATFVSAVAALALTSGALARIIQVSPSGYETITNGDVFINAASAPNGTLFTVSTTNAINDALGAVTVAVGNRSTSAPAANNRYIEVSVTNAKSLGSITKASGSGELFIRSVEIRESIGQSRTDLIRAETIGTVTSGRNILASIRSDGSTYSPSLASTGIYSIETNGANPAYCTDGNIEGDITADTRGIKSIIAKNTLGSSGTTVTTVASDGRVETVEAGTLSWVTIYMPNSDIGVLRAKGNLSTGSDPNNRVLIGGGWGGDEVYPPTSIFSTPPSPTPGQLSSGGTLVARKVSDIQIAKSIAGGLDGTGGTTNTRITVSQPPAASAIWRIGGSLASGARIELPANGLTHSIVINNAYTGAAWSGTVSIAGNNVFPQSGPYYTDIPRSVGGGAVGLARFRFYPAASTPTTVNLKRIGLTGTTAELQCIDRQHPPVILSHYGPVGEATGANLPSPIYTIERLDGGGSNGGWTDVTSQFSNGANYGRDVRIDPPCVGGQGCVPTWQTKTYRFTLNTAGDATKLLSTGVLDNSNQSPTKPYVPAYTHSVTFVASCDLA